ncbi:FTR1 family protein [Candidatus Thioglobus sp.]|jgi:high-affinity iron transporter|nr:FTR1 family protein [Candidatus Thioglobus sp.]|tara:strand:- start:2133 stop:2957 length:825 start_codon:yes stop_codon:yes gene_type:complete
MTQLPSFIMGFREGLEAFLLITITLKYISKIDKGHLKNIVAQGAVTGLIISIFFGLLLSQFAEYLGGVSSLTKLWESAASLVALLLVSVFIVWMIRHGTNMSKFLENELSKSISKSALFWISCIIIAREGTEIAIFSFAGKFPYEFVGMGVLTSLILSILIFYSLVKVNISLLFKITLAYLILQAGFLLGYSIHEGFSALKSYSLISPDNYIFERAFNFSNTFLSHKDGVFGIPLHVLFGWYSKPEWIQFIVQYLFTFCMFGYWFWHNKKITSS